MNMKKMLLPAFIMLLQITAQCNTISGTVTLEIRVPPNVFVAEYEKSSVRNPIPIMSKTSNDMLKRYRMHPRQRASNVLVQIQTISDMKTVSSGRTDDKGRYSIQIKTSSTPLRAYAVAEIGQGSEMLRFIGSRPVRPYDTNADIILRNTSVSLTGRCIKDDGDPAVGMFVTVNQHLDAEAPEALKLYPEMRGVSDKNGYWRVDGLDSPNVCAVASHMCDTNLFRYTPNVNHLGSALRVTIRIGQEYFYHGDWLASSSLPLVTETLRKTAERYLDAVSRKGGRIWERKAPMTIFPVSTNNVIYVGDIVLPEKKRQ